MRVVRKTCNKSDILIILVISYLLQVINKLFQSFRRFGSIHMRIELVDGLLTDLLRVKIFLRVLVIAWNFQTCRSIKIFISRWNYH